MTTSNDTEKIAMAEKQLLLHACCGPCSMEPVRLLREDGIEPVIYYANSNIQPEDEYTRRLETLTLWARDEALEAIEGSYDSEAWEATAGRIGQAARERFGVIIHEASFESLPDSVEAPPDGTEAPCAPDAAEAARQARCRACYRLRFEETARYAAEHGFAAIGTTLSVSPYQYTAIIREELVRAAAKAGVAACFADYRPYYDTATKRSREAGMYRQNYCACRFSDEESQLEREMRKQARREAKAAEAAARANEAAAEASALKAKRAEKAAYADKQARKRAILKQLREQQ